MNYTNCCSGQKIDKRDPIHHMSHPQGRPELPPLPVSASEEPSELYQTIMSHSFYPPLMQHTSWTLAVPFKEQDQHRGPSDSIGNNYSLTARDLKLKDLPKFYQPSTINSSKNTSSQGTSLGPKTSSSEPTKKKMKFSSKFKDDASGMPVSCKCSSTLNIKPNHPCLIHPGSRPMSPEQQMDVMLQQEMEIDRKEKIPTESDLERYYYYLTNGIRKDMISPEDEEVMERICKLIPKELLTTPALEPLQAELRSEMNSDYYFSLMKSIVDYILMDPMEKKRLFIESIPRLFPQRVIRAPVPWHNIYQSSKKWNEEHLHIVNPMMYNLKKLWFAE